MRRDGPRPRHVAAALAVALSLAAPAARAQTSARLQEARDAMEAGDDARARALFAELSRSASLREAATAVYYLAAMADEALDFPGALRGYQDFLARDPGSRFAARAQARVEDLQAHGEGDFRPLAVLERVRRDEALSNTIAGIESLDRAIEAFPAGPVRAEARMLVGEAYLNRLQRPREAVRVLRALAEDPGASQDLRSLAAEKLVEARGLMGEERAAAREVGAMRVDPEVKENAAVMARRKLLRQASWALVSLTAAIGVAAAARASLARRFGDVLRVWRRPLPLAQLAMLTLGGGLLARLYDDHEIAPFLVLGGGGLGVYLAGSAWNLVGSDRAPMRALRGAVCLSAALAVSFLAMDTLDPMMLEGIHL